MTDTNKMRDPVREQFEAVFSEAFPLIFAAAKAGEAKAHGDMSVAWWGWQASRQAVVVVLPERGKPFTVADIQSYSLHNEGRNLALDQCAQAIEAQGLRVGVRT